jgi:heme/copper-type cytochrome/quinol oxidase subunit 2
MMDLEAVKEKKYLSVNKVLVLPANEYIRVLITSEDVIHSWALPQLGIKVDAIPGRMQIFLCYSNRFGVFYGQCSELCGVNHGFMPICVEFVPGSFFLDWYLKNLEVRPYKLLLSLVNS